MNAAPNLRLAAAAAVRAELHDAGYLPVALYSYDCRHHWLKPEDPGKRPKGDRWEERARQDPPEAAVAPPELDALETGILADGLRIFDLDVNDATAVAQLRAVAIKHGGETVVRWRENSPRIAMVYRAAEGEPLKQTLAGGKWEDRSAGLRAAACGFREASERSRPAVGTRGPNVGPTPHTSCAHRGAGYGHPCRGSAHHRCDGTGRARRHRARQLPHTPSVLGPSADPLDVTAALAVIPNDGAPDWEWWNKIGMATYAATGGSLVGFAAWMAWSERNPAHDPALCQERWDHYPKAEPSSIGAGTLFHMAREARPEWVKPTDLNGGPAATFIERARKAGRRPSEDGDTPHGDTAGPASGTAPPEEDINAQEEVQDLCNRIEERCASNKTLAKRWRGDWSGLTSNAPSHRAFALVAALKRAGFDFGKQASRCDCTVTLPNGHRRTVLAS